MKLVDKLKQYIDTIQFVEGVTYVSINLPKDWVIVKNTNFRVEKVETKNFIVPNHPSISLDGCLEYLNQIFEFNQELVHKKHWLKEKIEELKELASTLTIQELQQITFTTIGQTNNLIDDDYGINETFTEKYINNQQEQVFDPRKQFEMEKEPDFDESELQSPHNSTESEQPKYFYNPETGDMEEMI